MFRKTLFLTLLMTFFGISSSVYAQATPTISGFKPTTASQGQTITISGQNLVPQVGFVHAGNQARTSAIGSAVDSNTITVTVPATLAPGDYIIYVGSANTGLDTLTVTPGNFIVPAYNPKAPAPLFGANSFAELIGAVFNYSFQLLGLIIFLTFLWAGFMWLGAGGNPGIIGKAKSRMTSAILGAVLILSSYLILNTINPDLINIGFPLPGINIGPGGPGAPGGPGPGGSATASQAAAQRALSAGINFTSANPDCGNPYHASQNIQDIIAGKMPAVCSPSCNCVAGGPSGNITVDAFLLDSLTALRQSGVLFSVTSLTTGKHGANSLHYQGRAADIVLGSQNSADWTKAVSFLTSRGFGAFCESKGGSPDPNCNLAVTDHIHLQR